MQHYPPTLSIFKNNLNNTTPVPRYFYHGERKFQVFLTRLRTNCSSLNQDLYTKNMSDTPLCACGLVENTYHYFFECARYSNIREQLIQSVNLYSTVSLPVLLYGDPSVPDTSNVNIVKAVHLYIKRTKRF